MNITKNQIDNLNATIKIELGKEDYSSRVESALKEYQKKVVVDGFRKGKTPMGIVKKMYGKAILVEEINKVIGEALSNFITENNLNILGEPLPSETEAQNFDLDKDDFEFVYDIALSPEVNAKLEKTDKVPYYTIDVDAEMIDKQIESICQNNGEMIDVESVEEGSEYLKGELIELDVENKSKEGGIVNPDASMSLYYMKDEESKKAFEGKKIGEEVVFNAAKAYPNKADFAAMLGITKEEAEHVDSNFCLIIKEIKRHKSAEVNEELFTKLYGEGVINNVEEFRAKIKEDIAKQLDSHSEYRFSVDAKEVMIAKNSTVELPEAFLKRWILATNKEATAEQIEADFVNYKDEFKWQLIKNEIAKTYEVKVEMEDMKAMAREIAAAQLQQYGLWGLTDEQLDGFATRLLEDEKQRRALYEKAIDSKIFATIKAHVTVEDKTISMKEFEALFQA